MNAFYKHDREEVGIRYHSEPENQSSRTNPLFQEDGEDVHKRYHPEPRRDHDRVSRGSMNFQLSPDRPRSRSTEEYSKPMKTGYYNETGDPHRRSFQNYHQTGSESDFRRQNQRNDVNDRKRSGETSLNDDRYVYIEAKSGDRRLYKKVEDEDLGGNALIYQPSNMPRPIQRENVESVGDNFFLRPAPAYTESQRSTLYDTIDMEKPYKIQRPNIKHNNL
ncbi:uncharacterized protein LOC133192420 [Saccostrea echinata]|uniref:uncharacterized protein LOC133192420 n=1 Tax=Saccostrea echinata TaxID=191078 RepID=UPI002A841497|nr:uncharacterized protein LOC133192420 [Saccostrea echinata]